MLEQLIDEDILIPVVAILSTFLWLIIATLSATLKGMFAVWRNTRLKERMLERGLSASEIQMVMGAGKNRSQAKPKKQGAAPVTRDAYDPQLTQTSFGS